MISNKSTVTVDFKTNILQNIFTETYYVLALLHEIRLFQFY